MPKYIIIQISSVTSENHYLYILTTGYKYMYLQATLVLEDALGRQALHHASQAGASAATELLITEGASVNAKATETGLTALHYAAKVRVGQPRSQSLHVCTIIASTDL